MKRALVLALAALPMAAHVMSMSSGDLAVSGARAHYELRMPLYEVAHVAHPERDLLAHVRFAAARMLSSHCGDGEVRGTYVCDADYDFAAPVERVEVECTLSAITVPNHVHLLRATLGGKRDEAVLDLAFPRATLRFRPATPAEIAITEAGAGFVRALGGVAQVVLLVALVLAGRSRRELAAIACAFIAGQAASVFGMAQALWEPAPRFVEAAAAAAVAYLAVEILLLPRAGSRWLVACVLGALDGLYFHLFVRTTAYSAGLVLAGAGAAEIAVIGGMAVMGTAVGRMVKGPRLVQGAAVALLAFGVVWFVIRLRS